MPRRQAADGGFIAVLVPVFAEPQQQPSVAAVDRQASAGPDHQVQVWEIQAEDSRGQDVETPARGMMESAISDTPQPREERYAAGDQSEGMAAGHHSLESNATWLGGNAASQDETSDG